MREIDLNPAYCDEAQGELTLPPVVLKLADLKDQGVGTELRE